MILLDICDTKMPEKKHLACAVRHQQVLCMNNRHIMFTFPITALGAC